MLVGLLNVAEVDRPVMGSAFTALKMSARNSKVLDSWNFQKWNLRTTDSVRDYLGTASHVIAARLHCTLP